MTAIVGIAARGAVWIGADTCASDDYTQTQIAHSKVFYRDVLVRDGVAERLLMAGAGSFRIMQLLEYALHVPAIEPGQSVISYLTLQFADEVRQTFRQRGVAKVVNCMESFNGNFLLGFRGQLYHIESSYQAIGVANQEYAAGTGGAYALGSLHTTRNLEWHPKDRVIAALEAAADTNLQSSRPFNVLKV